MSSTQSNRMDYQDLAQVLGLGLAENRIQNQDWIPEASPDAVTTAAKQHAQTIPEAIGLSPEEENKLVDTFVQHYTNRVTTAPSSQF